jgi:serine/threonine protein kinase
LLREQKLNYLSLNFPDFAAKTEADNFFMLAWPLKNIFENGSFVGFLMPKVAGKSLEMLCTPKLPKGSEEAWQRFDFSHADALSLRLKVCFNLAVAVQKVHALGQYAFIDLKPDNMLIRPDGLLSLVDIDSIAVFKGAERLFSASVTTPDFTPPEFYFTRIENNSIYNETWDRFSLAVIIYKLLLGIHPFAATACGAHESAVSLAAKIEAGLFVQDPNMRNFLSAVPDLHKNFDKLPEALRDAFLQSFSLGHQMPELRFSAEEWCRVLSFSEQKNYAKSDKAPFNIKKAILPELPMLPALLLENPKERLALQFEQNRELSILNFSNAQSKSKKTWWLKKSTKEIWEKSAAAIPEKLLAMLKNRGLDLESLAALGACFSDWELAQKTAVQDCETAIAELLELMKIFENEIIINVIKINKKLSAVLQKERTEKQSAYKKLLETKIWQDLKGGQLAAKMGHLQRLQHGAEAELKQDFFKTMRAVEQEESEEISLMTQAYYAHLQLIEQKCKRIKDDLEAELQGALDQELKESDWYIQKLENTKKKEAAFLLEQETLQKELSLEIAAIEAQFLQNYQALSPSEEKKRALLSEMQALEISQKNKIYEETLNQKTLSFQEVQKLEKLEFQEHYEAEKQSLLTKKYQSELKEIANAVQQRLQELKAEAEIEFIAERQAGMSRMQQRKRAEKEKYEQALAQLRLDFSQKEKALTAAFEQYEQAQESAKKEADGEYSLLCSEFEALEKTSREQIENAYFALRQKIEIAAADVLSKWTLSFG